MDMFDFKRLVVKYMREVADKIEVGTSEISESEAIEILRVIAHESLSKAQAASYLRTSPQNFDLLIRQKQIPPGRKVVGFKEKRWYKDELDICLYKIKKSKK
jgi:hypothetical protein